MTREPSWLTLSGVTAIHDALLAEHGGAAGIRDFGALQSALDRPRNRFLHEGGVVPSLGAAYAIALVRPHAFTDGNKRTAFVCAAVFLERNGFAFRGPETEVVVQMVSLAAKTLGEAAFSAWFCGHSTARRARRKRAR